MQFFRNGERIVGATVSGVPTNEPLHLVAIPFHNGAAVTVSWPGVEYEEAERKRKEEAEEAERKEAEARGKEEFEWDEEWKGDNITLSAGAKDGGRGLKTVATTGSAGDEGRSVRSKQAIMPRSGVHCFEYVFTKPGRSTDGASLGGGCIVGVATATPLSSRARGFSKRPGTDSSGESGERS